jgi:hypothetical protein
MTREIRIFLAVLALAVLPLTGCAQVALAQPKTAPVVIHAIDENISSVTLTAKAAERLGIATDTVREQAVDGQQRKVVPYASVLYDPDGKTWAYTSPEPLVFVRQALVIDRIQGDLAILADGPPVGTAVAIRGVAELHGSEYGVGGDE